MTVALIQAHIRSPTPYPYHVTMRYNHFLLIIIVHVEIGLEIPMFIREEHHYITLLLLVIQVNIKLLLSCGLND